MTDFGENRKALRARRLFGYSLAAWARVLLAIGLVLTAFSVTSIYSSRSDVPTETVALGADGLTPALHLGAASIPALRGQFAGPDGALGTVIVVHGFAGSKEFMRDIDYSLARAGFEVYGIDLPGHGRSGLVLKTSTLTTWFSDLLDDMVTKGQLTPGSIYLVGHSLGTIVVTRGALDNPGLGIRGVVALSPVFGDITPTDPPNYLALFGQSEIGGVKETAMKALRLGTGLSAPALETTYGDYALGTARGAAEVKGATHVTIPDNKIAIGSTISWLRSASGRPISKLPRLEGEKAERAFGAIGLVMFLLGVFYYGAGALGLLGHGGRLPRTTALIQEARVAAGLTARPEVLAPPARAPGGAVFSPKPAPPAPLPPSVIEAGKKATELLAGTRVIPLVFALAAVVAVVVPGFLGTFGFLKQNGVDYLAMDLLVFAVVAGPLLVLTGRFIKAGRILETGTRLGVPVSLAFGVGLTAVFAAAIGWFVTVAWTNIVPAPSHALHTLLLFALFAPFAVVDELARATIHDRAGFTWGFFTVVIGKILLILSWYLGLFFPVAPTALLLVGPLLIGVMVVLDLVLSLLYNDHGSWLVNAVLKAGLLAGVVAAVFPYVA